MMVRSTPRILGHCAPLPALRIPRNLTGRPCVASWTVQGVADMAVVAEAVLELQQHVAAVFECASEVQPQSPTLGHLRRCSLKHGLKHGLKQPPSKPQC